MPLKSRICEKSYCFTQASSNSLAPWTKPTIFNSDQASQFTSSLFVQILENQGISISRDGKGRALDNVFIERFWRSLKYECIYLHSFADGKELQKGLERYVYFYNFERKHQALNYLAPAQIYLENKAQF